MRIPTGYLVARDRAGNIFAEQDFYGVEDALWLAATWLRAGVPLLEVRQLDEEVPGSIDIRPLLDEHGRFEGRPTITITAPRRLGRLLRGAE